jgi:acyl-CoA synthetase (AMP-forming)/AMP-acid ligase II/carbon monoxide dehydrogenase subunit G
MRVEQTIDIDAPCDEVWDLVTDPETYTKILAGITRFDVEGRKQRGLGARYAMRMEVGSAQIGGLVEVVEFDAPSDMAWTSVTGLDHRVRWRLRENDDGTTRVTFRLSYQSPGALLGTVADYVSSPIVERTLRESLQRLKAEMEGDQMADNDGPGLLDKAWLTLGQGVHTVKTLAEAGLIKPERPDKTVRALLQIQRWGYTPAAGYAANASRYGNDDAIIDELGHLTFAEVHDRTNRLANAWSDAGLVEGDSIGVMCRNHRYFIDAVVAASKMGVNCLLLNTAFAGPQLAEVVQREKPVALIYDEEFTELLEEAGKRRKRFIGWYDPEATEKEKRTDPTLDELIDEADPDEPVPPVETGRVVILTSGTTGTPKGASRKQPETIGPAVSLLSRIPLRAREKTFIVAPLFHSWGFAHFTLGLMLGSTYILKRKFDPENTLSTIAEHQVQSAPMVPVMVQRIMQLPKETRTKYDLSSLRSIPLSGSALPGELAIQFMDEFGDVLYNLYGSTEVAWATIATPEDLRESPGTAGAPPRGTILRIYDENGKELPQGETGRIFVGNEMLFEGYTGGGNKDVIDGLMSSGDVGYLDEEGRLHVSGRDDDMIVSGGENVFPREVEDLISNMKGVDEVAVIGVDDEEFGQRLKAFVVTKGSGGPSEDEIKSKVKSDLARYKVPREVEFLDELPRNATGKVLKKELKEREEDGDGGDNGSKSKRGGKRKKAAAKS